ncbi:unnamed protein product [Schistosoma spindalis]|nr:unnamed protein product [Schistosoma spindale]
MLNYKFFNCQHDCDQVDMMKERKLVFKSDTYEYSNHYYYFQTIRLNQTSPVLNEKFERLVSGKSVISQSRFTFYGADVNKLYINMFGLIRMYGSWNLGTISNHMDGEIQIGCEILDKRLVYNVTTLTYPNGKISFYYENIPEEIGEIPLKSSFSGSIQCEKGGQRFVQINVPEEWIKSGTLVEHEVSGEQFECQPLE